MIRVLIALVLASWILHAQSAMNRTFNLENGARVLYTTYTEGKVRDPFGPGGTQLYGTAAASGNVIERTMTDGSNRTWLGFQLRIERIPGDGPIRFNLSMEPLGGWGFFGQKAAPRVIENGDRILLDVLQEPGTGRRFFDTFQVGIGVGMQLPPPTRSIPQMPPAGAVVHLQSPHMNMSGTNAMISMGGSDASISGVIDAVTVPGKGRFTFSAHPEPGFRMEGAGEGNVLAFVVGTNLYSVECSGPVMDGPGAWYLWVRFEPAPEKRADVPTLELTNRDREIQK